MRATALQERLQAADARMGGFCGAETAASFGDAAAEYRALRSGCAVYDLGWRAKLLVTGKDRVRWLNGMVTNNIRDLPGGRGVYSFLLNPQGRILADMDCYQRGEYLLIDTDVSQAGTLKTVFDKYIIMDDVEINSADDKLTAVGVAGPRAAAALEQALGAQSSVVEAMQALELVDLAWSGIGLTLARAEDELTPRFEIWMASANAPAVWDALLAAGAKPAGTEALEMLRICSGRPRYGQDITERQLPQETGQDRALNYSKGCYVGQEIVERIHARAILHREFVGFEFTGALPAPGAAVQADGKDVGFVTSVAGLPGDDGPPRVGLGYVRREAAPLHTAVRVGEIEGRVVRPPFVHVPAHT